MYRNDYAAHTTQVEALAAPSAPSTPTRQKKTPSFEIFGISNLNGTESRLKKEIQEGFYEHKFFVLSGMNVMNQKFDSLCDRLSHVEAEVKSLREAVGEPVEEPIGKPFVEQPHGEADGEPGAEAVGQPDGQTGGQTCTLCFGNCSCRGEGRW